MLCLLGETFVPPTLAPPPKRAGDCLLDNGADYTGDLAVSLGGHTCLQWSLPEVMKLSQGKDFLPDVSLVGNKCRNPDNDPEGPWCYVDRSGNVTVDYCDLRLCGNCHPGGTAGNRLQRANSGGGLSLMCLSVCRRGTD